MPFLSRAAPFCAFSMLPDHNCSVSVFCYAPPVRIACLHVPGRSNFRIAVSLRSLLVFSRAHRIVALQIQLNSFVTPHCLGCAIHFRLSAACGQVKSLSIPGCGMPCLAMADLVLSTPLRFASCHCRSMHCRGFLALFRFDSYPGPAALCRGSSALCSSVPMLRNSCPSLRAAMLCPAYPWHVFSLQFRVAAVRSMSMPLRCPGARLDAVSSRLNPRRFQSIAVPSMLRRCVSHQCALDLVSALSCHCGSRPFFAVSDHGISHHFCSYPAHRSAVPIRSCSQPVSSSQSLSGSMPLDPHRSSSVSAHSQRCVATSGLIISLPFRIEAIVGRFRANQCFATSGLIIALPLHCNQCNASPFQILARLRLSGSMQFVATLCRIPYGLCNASPLPMHADLVFALPVLRRRRLSVPILRCAFHLTSRLCRIRSALSRSMPLPSGTKHIVAVSCRLRSRLISSVSKLSEASPTPGCSMRCRCSGIQLESNWNPSESM